MFAFQWKSHRITAGRSGFNWSSNETQTDWSHTGSSVSRPCSDVELMMWCWLYVATWSCDSWLLSSTYRTMSPTSQKIFPLYPLRMEPCECDIHIVIIIIIVIAEIMFMVLSSWQSRCKSSPGSFDECRLSAEVATNWLGLWVRQKEMTAIVRIHHRHFIITQPESWYSFYHPTEGGRLSGPIDTAVRVCSPYPRLYIAVAVMINTTAGGEIGTWVLSHPHTTVRHVVIRPHCHYVRVRYWYCHHCIWNHASSLCASMHFIWYIISVYIHLTVSVCKIKCINAIGWNCITWWADHTHHSSSSSSVAVVGRSSR